MGLLGSWFWPKVSDRKNAQFAITEACLVALVMALYTAIFATVQGLKDSVEGFNADGFIIAILFAGVGFGLYRKSRVAAVSGLVLYLVERGYVWVKVAPSVGIVPLLVALAFLHGVRGTFAYHKLPPRPAGLPSLAQSFDALERPPSESEKNVAKAEEKAGPGRSE